MIKVLVVCVVLSTSIGVVMGQRIQFQSGTWAEVQAKARATHKLIFVDAFAVWCGPCKAMAKNVFTQPAVAEHFNATYINYAVDAEKGEGVDLAKKYKVESFPTYLFVDGEGKLVYRIEGAQTADAFLAEAKKADEKK